MGKFLKTVGASIGWNYDNQNSQSFLKAGLRPIFDGLFVSEKYLVIT